MEYRIKYKNGFTICRLLATNLVVYFGIVLRASATNSEPTNDLPEVKN